MADPKYQVVLTWNRIAGEEKPRQRTIQLATFDSALAAAKMYAMDHSLFNVAVYDGNRCITDLHNGFGMDEE